MPGSVTGLTPTVVMPIFLCRAFTQDREFPVLENEYRDGRSQRLCLASESRKRWRLSARLRSADLTALRSFYEARRGRVDPFYFYDPWETSPLFAPDPSGSSAIGRYVVRFDGDWEDAIELARSNVALSLVELYA